MDTALILWSHALAALLFGMIALSQIRLAPSALPRLTFQIALLLTALWALAVAGIGSNDVIARVAESVRNIAWLSFMFALVRRDRGAPGSSAISYIYGIVGLIMVISCGLTIIESALSMPGRNLLVAGRVNLAIMVCVSALLLVHQLYSAVAPRARGGIRLVAGALAAMWSVDLTLYAAAFIGGEVPPALVAMRGVVVALLAPVFAVAVHHNGDWTLQLSRTIAYQSISLAAIALYLLLMTLATSMFAAIGGAEARIAQTAFVFGSTSMLIGIVSTPRLRAWAKVKLAKHFFSHRYDYRVEWLRFTETLGKPGDGAAPLDARVVKAVADLTDSPAGLLLVPDRQELGVGVGWNWDRPDLPVSTAPGLARYLEATGQIIELDAVRADKRREAKTDMLPHWMLDRDDAWVLVPLVHFGKLAGAILLARPPVDRRPDWEDLDLLRIAGRQAASYLAEARAQEALSDAQRFDEFNRRFAFIMHDIKNLVSQLSLVSHNAERHADNPAFRADMIATLKDSTTRMNDLLARLSQHHNVRSEAVAPTAIGPLVARVADGRRAQHAVTTRLFAEPCALADPVRVEQLLGHLVQNAIEASDHDDPVTITVDQSGHLVIIDVIDHGTGMAPAFVRDRLFKPFVSSKPGGFGLGAFEARQLAEAMGGRVDVFSREGEGTRFRVTLPVAAAVEHAREQAA